MSLIRHIDILTFYSLIRHISIIIKYNILITIIHVYDYYNNINNDIQNQDFKVILKKRKENCT